MKHARLIVLSVFVGMPLLLSFQNCSAGKFSAQSDLVSSQISNLNPNTSTRSEVSRMTGGDVTALKSFINSKTPVIDSMNFGVSAKRTPAGVATKLSDEASVNLVACGAAQFEFPMATHWSNAANKFVEGANDELGIYESDAASTGKVYKAELLPSINKYIGTNYEVSRITDERFVSWSKTQCASTGVAFELRRPRSFQNWSVARQQLVESRGSVQMMHALVLGENLITLLIPPNWKKSDARGKYPILVNGYYDLKLTGFEGETINIAQAMGKAWKASQTPFIGVQWNGGGAVASRTINPRSRVDFNKIIQQIADQFGGDPDRIAMFGASRGGTTALSIASNPDENPYKVVAAFVNVPALNISNAAFDYTSTTVPSLLGAVEWSTGLVGTWNKNFIYPSEGTSMDGMTRGQAHQYVLAGSGLRADAENSLSLSSPKMLKALRKQGTRIFFEAGSHDIICPWVDQFRFMNLLETFGIPFEARTNYLSGHSDSSSIDENSFHGGTGLARLMIQISERKYDSIFKIGQKSYYQTNSSTGLAQVDGAKFTFEFPRFQYPSIDGLIIMTGIAGTAVEFDGTYNDAAFKTQSHTLDADGTKIINLAGQPAGVYHLTSLRIKKPGTSTWKNIDFKNSSTTWSPDRLVLEVKSADPLKNTPAYKITEEIVQGYLGGPGNPSAVSIFSGVSYGVVEGDADSAVIPKKSCTFAGGTEGTECYYGPAKADDGVRQSVAATTGGTGSISGTCNNGKWENVVKECRVSTSAAKKSCSFAGGAEGTACTFAAASGAHGFRASSSVIAGGSGSISATCNDGKWENVVKDCKPAHVVKKSCTYSGGTEGTACTFAAASAAHSVSLSSAVLAGGTGSISATCNDGQWKNISIDCR